MTPRDLPILTRAAVRELDRIAIEEFGMPSVVLMENAGRAAAQAVLHSFRAEAGELGTRLDSALILCGSGNNGGDGYVVARHLHEAHVRVPVLETVRPDRLSRDAAVFRRVCVALGIELRRVEDGAALSAQCATLSAPDVFIDALFGTGFEGELRPSAQEILTAASRCLAAWGTPVVALDCPSGFDVDRGEHAEPCLRAALTLTFAANKPALASGRHVDVTGRVEVLPIGVPAGVYERLV